MKTGISKIAFRRSMPLAAALAAIGFVVGASCSSRGGGSANRKPSVASARAKEDTGPAAQAGAVDIDSIAARYAQRLARELPAGWSATADRGVVTARRNEPVEWYNAINPPTHKVEELKRMGFVQRGPYSIRIRLLPPPSAAVLARMRTDNDRIAKQREAVTTDRQRRFGLQYTPETQEEKAKYAEYERLQAALRRPPDVVADDAGAIIDNLAGEAVVDPNWSGVGAGWFMFYSADVREDCRAVGRLVESLLGGREKLMTPASKANVVREGTKTYIAGLEKIEWGGASLYQNSNIAALTFAQQAAGDEADYMDLMGKSGLAFRIQFQVPDGCPSSPHACCGFDSWQQALWACGRAVEVFDTREGNPATIEKARAAVVASIDRGWPVIYASEETGLAVGYVDAGRQLLIRPYSPKAQGYETTDKWPWQIIVLSPKKAPPPRKDVLVNSLRLAVHLWQTPRFGQYASGQAAYDAWAKLLEDDKRFQSPDPKALWGICHANGFTYGCLENSRQFAVKYLRSIQTDFSPPAADHLRQAAALYEKSHEAIGRPGQGIDPWGLFPWDLKGGSAWTPTMRHAQAAVLRDMAGFDKHAVAELQLALQAEGVTEDLPPVPAAAQETPGKATPDYSKLALKGDENAKDSFSLTVQAVARVYGIDVDYETVYALSGSGFAPGIHPPEDCRQLQRMHDRGQGLDIVAARLGLALRPLEFADKSKAWTEIRRALARGEVVLTDRGWRDAPYTFWGILLDAPANGPVNDIIGATLTGRTDHRLDHVGRCWAVTLGKPTMTPEQADVVMLQRAVARIRGDKPPFLPGNVVYGLKAMDLWIADMKKPSFQPGDPASSLGNAACCALYTSEGARDVCSYLRRRLATFPEGARPHVAAAADQYDFLWRTLKPFAVPTGGYAGVIGDQARQKDHAGKVLLPCKEALAKAADHLEKAVTALNMVEY